MPLLPPDLQTLTDDIDAADRDGAALAATVSEQQFLWQPELGDGRRGWSIAQCLDHLAIINRLYSRPIQQAVDEARAAGWTRTGPAMPGPVARWFIGSQEPPVTRRLRTPGAAQPAQTIRPEDVLRAYHDAHDVLRQLIVDAAEVDVNRAMFRNPFIPLIRMKVATGLTLLPAHERRHLWQAARVRHEAGYPRGG